MFNRTTFLAALIGLPLAATAVAPALADTYSGRNRNSQHSGSTNDRGGQRSDSNSRDNSRGGNSRRNDDRWHGDDRGRGDGQYNYPYE